ncbi:hypothetical protein SBBP1_590005 [Burkholderiales bacterium]|nr:hypothetical protein SBBP1_590005 [Burkholderiales bacterium]
MPFELAQESAQLFDSGPEIFSYAF